jgi:hypothetical protein
MAASEVCVVCGCDIALLPGKAGKPVRHSGKMYCGDCAELVLDQNTMMAADEIELDEIEVTEEPVKKTGGKVANGGIQVVEEFKIKAGTPVVREKRVDDDSWFQQPVAKPTPAGSGRAPGIKKSARVEAAPASKGSGRLPAKAAVAEAPAPAPSVSSRSKPSGTMKAASKRQEVDESLETHAPAKKSSRRMASPSARSERPGSISRNKVAPATKKAPPPPVEEELVSEPPEVSDAEELKLDEVKPAGAGSRASKVFKVDRRSAKAVRAQEREDRESRRSKARGGAPGKNSNMMMIGGGIAGVVLLIIIAICAGGSSDKKAPVQKAATTTENPVSASEFAARAKQKEDRGDRLGAADDYQRAAEACGSSDMATQYNMHAYQLRKFTTLNVAH